MPRKTSKSTSTRKRGGKKSPLRRTSSKRDASLTRPHRARRTPTPVATHLSESEINGILIEGIIINRDGTSDNYDESEIDELRVALRKLTYDTEYKSCFDGRKIPTFYAQALEKVGCWLKNDTEIK